VLNICSKYDVLTLSRSRENKMIWFIITYIAVEEVVLTLTCELSI